MTVTRRVPWFVRWPLGLTGAALWALGLTVLLLWIVDRYLARWVNHSYAAAPYLANLVLRVYFWEAISLGLLGGLLIFWLAWDRLRDCGVL
jgi:hypothetical protein